MPEAPAAPAASAPAPAPTPAPATPAPAPVTPPIPAAQAASAPKPAGTKPPSNTPPKPPPTVDDGLRKLSEEVFKEGPEGDPAPPPQPAKKPDPAPEAKPAKPDATPFDGMELPANASEAQKSNFKALKEQAAQEVNRLKNEIAAARQEVETYKKATPADLADIERTKQELKAAQDRLAVFDVSSHPDFRRQYTEPKAKALGVANELAKEYGVPNAAELKALIDLPRPEFAKRLTEMAKDMPSFDQNKFFNSMDEARNIQQQEAGALSKAGEVRAAMQAKAAQEARSAFEASRGEFTQKVPELQVPEGASDVHVAEIKAYNKARSEAIAKAEKYTFGSMNEREVADLATRAATLEMVAGHTIPMMSRQLKEARELIAAQNEQLTAIAAKKNPGSFAAPAGDQGTQQPTNLQELAKQVFGSQG